MEFRLDDGQRELQDTVARFCADHFPLDAIVTREGAAVDRDAWQAMAKLGLLGLLVGEDGLGLVEATIAFEQLGSHLVPGPVLWTALAAAVLPEAATGEVLVGGIDATAIADRVALVEHGAEVDRVLILGADGVRVLNTESLTIDQLDPLDPLTPVARLTGLAGELIGDREAAASLRLNGTVLSAALLSGLAERSLEVARTYALERQQFGTAIGSFQAVKHLLADMFVRSRMAQSATYAAAAVVDEPGRDDPMRAAAAAKVLAGDAAVTNASTAVQILGGMGFTWEMLPNHLLKRAWVLEHGFGTVDEHALSLGTTLAGVA
jgi:alkylation response protein AidB-like acyl-CoA dehydrogenase